MEQTEEQRRLREQFERQSLTQSQGTLPTVYHQSTPIYYAPRPIQFYPQQTVYHPIQQHLQPQQRTSRTASLASVDSTASNNIFVNQNTARSSVNCIAEVETIPARSSVSSHQSTTPTSSIPSHHNLPAEEPYSNGQETLEEYRKRVKKCKDPAVIFEFAKYLITQSERIHQLEPNPKLAKKHSEALTYEAIKWMRKLCSTNSEMGKLGYAEAQFYLASCYGNGSCNVSIDHDKAFNLYFQSSKQNHPAATYRTAVCYEVGAGTKRDPVRAVQYYRKASALGDTASMYKLGMILTNGLLNVPPNVKEGLSWLKRAADQADEDNPHALHELGLLYEGASGIDTRGAIIPDPGYAHDLFLRAAQLGFPQSQFKLGMCFEYGLLNLPVNPRRSIAWYTRAAEHGDPDAELALSGWYLTGSDVLQQSDSEAYLWARKAADKGLAKAEYALGYFSENGIGVVADMEEARKCYLRAAGQGNKNAIQRLKEMRVGSSAAASRPPKDFRKEKGTKNGECTIQ